jgi:hypothetical protein
VYRISMLLRLFADYRSKPKLDRMVSFMRPWPWPFGQDFLLRMAIAALSMK